MKTHSILLSRRCLSLGMVGIGVLYTSLLAHAEVLNYATNGSFESGTYASASSYSYVIWGGNIPYNADPGYATGNFENGGSWYYTSTGWTSGTSGTSTGYYARPTTADSVWNSSTPDGSRFAAIQVFHPSGNASTANLSTNITGLTPGNWYYLSYQYMSRGVDSGIRPVMTTSLTEGRFTPTSELTKIQDSVEVGFNKSNSGYRSAGTAFQATAETMTFTVTNAYSGSASGGSNDASLLFDNLRVNDVKTTLPSANLIKDGSFEAVNTTYTTNKNGTANGFVVWGMEQTLDANHTASGNFTDEGTWKWKNVTVAASDTNSQSCGFLSRFNSATQPVWSSVDAPDGTYAAVVQNFTNNGYGTTSVEQTVDTLSPGKMYFVQYDYNVRDNQTAKVSSNIYSDTKTVDLQPLTTVSPTASYKTYGKVFTATDSSMTLSIANTTTNKTDSALLLDNVRMTEAAAQKASNLVRDGSFETGVYTIENGGLYTIWSPNHPNGKGDFEKGSGIWQFSTSGVSSEFNRCPAGFYGRGTSGNVFSSSQVIPDGTYSAAIQCYKVTAATAPAVASISQEISGMETGAYYGIAYHYNARPDARGAIITSTFSDGANTTTFQDHQTVDATTNYKQYSGVFQAASESGTLTFANSAPASLDSTLNVDKVQLVRLPSVPMEAGMTPVHALDMTTAQTQSYNNAGVPYSFNASDSLRGKLFDKVGYYVELLDQSNQLQTLYITMDAFTTDASKIGVPANVNAAGYQAFEGTELTGVQVVSNVNGVSRTLNTGGKLEYWAGNYSAYLDGKFNGFDSMVAGNGFGSMQIHDATTGDTLFSFSGWGSNASLNATVGIGNSDNVFSGYPVTDWTGTGTIKAGNYAVANLYSFIHEADAVLSTNGTQLFQRKGNSGEATIAGTWDAISNSTVDKIQVSANGTDWTDVTIDTTNQTYSGSLTLETGWHDVEIRALNASGDVLTSTFEKVGIGEIFITCGQSNAANYGGATQYSHTGNVYEYNVATGKWSLSIDPQTGANGSGGSTWPIMGDKLTEMFGGDVPIGVVSTAVGGSSITSWDPETGGNYARLKSAIESLDGRFAAVLWHQGETDSAGNNSTLTPDKYQEILESLITETQGLAHDLSDSEIAWMVALVSYFNGVTDEELRDAQAEAVANTNNSFLGPDSDALSSLLYRISSTNVHFNEYGLNVLGDQWAFLVGTKMYGLPEPCSWSLLLLGLVFLVRRNRR